MKNLIETIKNIVLLILVGIVETLLMVILLLLYPMELLMEGMVRLWKRTTEMHQRMLEKHDLI